MRVHFAAARKLMNTSARAWTERHPGCQYQQDMFYMSLAVLLVALPTSRRRQNKLAALPGSCQFGACFAKGTRPTTCRCERSHWLARARLTGERERESESVSSETLQTNGRLSHLFGWFAIFAYHCLPIGRRSSTSERRIHQRRLREKLFKNFSLYTLYSSCHYFI